jgi:TrmH family RNA methyltransferase
MIELSSKSNEHFKRWLELNSSRGIKKNCEFILMGKKLIHEFLDDPQFKVKAEIVTEDLSPIANSASSLRGQKIPAFKLSRALFNEIDCMGTHWNLLVLEPKDLREMPLNHQVSGLEIVCPLGDPSNLGALARSALAFGASKMILTEESCNPFLPKAIKASAGALLKIPIFKAGRLKDYLANNDSAYTLDIKGESIAHFKWPENLQLAIGEEGPGLGEIKGLKRLRVPTTGVESLNANVAASVALFCYSTR